MSDIKNHTFSVRITQKEYRKLNRAASKKKTSAAQIIRECIKAL